MMNYSITERRIPPKKLPVPGTPFLQLPPPHLTNSTKHPHGHSPAPSAIASPPDRLPVTRIGAPEIRAAMVPSSRCAATNDDACTATSCSAYWCNALKVRAADKQHLPAADDCIPRGQAAQDVLQGPPLGVGAAEGRARERWEGCWKVGLEHGVEAEGETGGWGSVCLMCSFLFF